jgi:predicted nucleotide-binding protein
VPSEIFRRVDTRYIASALSENTTHSGISAFELGLGLQTEGNKGERANQVIRYIFDQVDTDGLVIQLLNYLFVENTYAVTSDQNTTYRQLRTNVLDPRGVTLTDNGFALPDGRDVDTIETVERSPSPPRPVGLDNLFGSLSQARESASTSTAELIERDRSKVFVVHGQDARPVDVIKQFLLYLGLQMMPWSEAIRLTGETQPHTYDVVRAGMAHAAAVIVIFSPDDLARVKDDFSQSGDPDRTPRGQARQNVTLEAGMAFATAPERTVFIRSAAVREISDVAGFNWVKLDGAWDSRNDLKNRLETANAAVRPGTYDLRDPLAGPFRVIPSAAPKP